MKSNTKNPKRQNGEQFEEIIFEFLKLSSISSFNSKAKKNGAMRFWWFTDYVTLVHIA
jgi:hypothetical protein